MVDAHDERDAASDSGDGDLEERAARLRLLTLAATLLAAVAPGLFWLARHPRPESPWMVVTVVALMVLAELFPIDLELRHESHSFSFSKIPIVMGAFLLAPFVAVAARFTSSLAVLWGVQRQPPIKLVINLLAHTLEVMIAVSVVTLLRLPGPFGVTSWAVAFLAVTAADLAAAFVISSAISAFQGRWEPGLVNGVVTGLVAGIPDIATAIAMVTLIEADEPAAWIVLGSGIAFAAVSRAYSKLTARYQAMQLLDRFTRTISSAVLNGTTTSALLAETAEILHADHAWLVVTDGDRARRITTDDTTVTERPAEPLDDLLIELSRSAGTGARLVTEDGVHGGELTEAGHAEVILCPVNSDTSKTVILVVADRSGTVRPFDAEDVALFETLSLHAGLALLNVDLVDQLREEITTTEHLANHDALTGLPNRTLFQRTIEASLAAGDRPAVLLIDLDRFKDVNDTLGHHNGDRLLREIAARLHTTLGDDRCVARLGGDEFAALLPGSPSHQDAMELAVGLAQELERPVTVAGVEVDVGASIGIAFASEDADPDTLLRQADVAMYTAKADRSVVEQYSADRDHYSPQRLSLVGRLRSAIDSGDLVLNYQPQLALATETVVGVEALVRWPQPGRLPIPPDEFIYVAEHTGLIRPLTRLVLDLAIAQAARWMQQGRDLRMSVNLSPHNLIEPGIVDAIASTLSVADVPPGRVMIEITESAVMANPKRTLGVLHDLRDLGVGIAIDDFGTGHSSLSYLTTLPATELKIDQSFVSALGSDPTADSIVRSVIDLGRNLHLDIIAEGVETENAAHTLTAMGCRLAQGYLYSRPLDVRAFEHWHANHDAALAGPTSAPAAVAPVVDRA